MTHKWWTHPSRVAAYITDTCDDQGDPSLVKMLCLAFALVCMFDMAARHVGAANSALSIVCIATAFGRSTFLAWLNRYTSSNALSASASSNVNVDAKLEANLTEMYKARLAARDPINGIDPA